MSGLSNRIIIQGTATLGVVATAIVVAASGATTGSAGAAPKAHVHANVPAPANVTSVTVPQGHIHHVHVKAKPQLRHPQHESWTKLLAGAPHGWTTQDPQTALSLTTLSQQFKVPSAVHQTLHFDGYRRGVMRGMKGGKIGRVEEIWQFRRPAGADAWFTASVSATRPGSGSPMKHQFVASLRSIGFTTTERDSNGYHYGVGLTLEGDMVVLTRVYGLGSVSQSALQKVIRQDARPVAKGITHTNLITALHHSIHGKKQKSTSTTT